MKTPTQQLLKATVVAKMQETHDVVTLSLAFEDKHPAFTAGQYLTVYFPELGTPEGKAYSISSIPSEPNVSITIKKIGRFSERLSALDEGDVLVVGVPYGFFYTDDHSTDLVFVAGGIGITPCMSMIRQNARQKMPRTMTLWWSNKTDADIFWKNELDALAKRYPTFSVVHHLTRDKGGAASGIVSGRLDPAVIAQAPNTAGSEFFICGSISFVRDMWRGLKEQGIPENRLNTESFY